MTRVSLSLLIVIIIALPLAASTSTPLAVEASSLQWKPASPPLPDGTSIALLEGDPKNPGMHTFRLRIPAGTLLDSHWHPFDERVTVLSGSLELGMGRRGEDMGPLKFGAGDFFITPQRGNHYLFFFSETVLQLTGIGPWEIHAAAPAASGKTKAELRIINVSPPEGSPLAPDAEIEVEVEYSVEPFRPSTFMIVMVFESTFENRWVGVTRSVAGAFPTPPRDNMLTQSKGRMTLRANLADVGGRPFELAKPVRMRVLLNETDADRSKSIAEAHVIEFRER
jgi:hypothetical protein